MELPISAEAIAMRRFYRWKVHALAETDDQAFEWFQNNKSDENWRLFYANFLPNVAGDLFDQREKIRTKFVDMPQLRDKKYLLREEGTKDEHGNIWCELLDIDQWKKDLDVWAKEVYDILNKEV